ncbi:ABC transporter ATP-binding protein [Candidatus Glomeribacter gigasporarum BEG34]|uniref:ABC transporter ATP-binding protein n=1 Tax=Candidatus Glomeribacter gigasporarum BEG34 TaxID=1070319 RepID=G2J8B7_9BURK|nr:ABC transporter ATP-binding protein [Candidatus Glomeribacter gigasporarum]CCD29014.1 ABC transporter ATP-binding protein [Candidatus Glomeribacter gigasporarum BEG34]
MHFLPKNLSGFLYHFALKFRGQIIAAQLCAFAWTINSTLWPYLIKNLIDAMKNYRPALDSFTSIFVPIFSSMVGLWIIASCMFRARGLLFAWIVPRFEEQVRLGVFDYLLQHSHRFFQEQMAGNLANKIADIAQRPARIFHLTNNFFIPTVLAALITAVVFSRISFVSAIIFIVWVSAHTGICLYFAPRCNALSETHAQTRSRLQGRIVDVIHNMLNVRIFVRQRFEHQQLLPLLQRDRIQQNQALLCSEKMLLCLDAACFVLHFGLQMGLAFFFWHRGDLTMGSVVLILNTTVNIEIMAFLSAMELPNLFREIGVCQQALSFIQTEPEIKDNPQAAPLRVARGRIEFERLSFAYQAQPVLFKEISLVLQAGQKTGLVGLSGGGKSTFVHLILRHYDLQSGRILIDGQDIRHVTQTSLHEQISFIPQEPILFHRDLMENIRYGKPDASDEAVFEAARRAHCDSFIMQLPHGYQTQVGERGTKLSGGQRQRIAIARALLKDAPILILDEATSALDSITEKAIQNSLADLMQGRTAIVIAHRLSTLAKMDRLLVLQNGKLIEDGTHRELLAAGEHYAALWRMQSGGFLPS